MFVLGWGSSSSGEGGVGEVDGGLVAHRTSAEGGGARQG